MSLIEIKIPDIGDLKDVAVIEIMVKPGDAIRLEQSLITVESDKAAMEIPSSSAGVLKELKVKLGDKVNVGDLLAILEGEQTAVRPELPVLSPVEGVQEQRVAEASPGLAQEQEQEQEVTAAVDTVAVPVATKVATLAVPAHNPT